MVGAGLNATRTFFTREIPQEVWEVTEEAWGNPFHLSSNLARENARAVAVAASLGWITAISPDGSTISRRWHVSPMGLQALTNRRNLEP